MPDMNDEAEVRRHNIELQKRVAELEDAITEHRRVEEVLRETNARLNTLQQVTADVHESLDPQKVFNHINNVIVNSMGFTTAIILTLDDAQQNYMVRSFLSSKKLTNGIGKILGLSLQNLTFPAYQVFGKAGEIALSGELFVGRHLVDIAYPSLKKATCQALEKLGGSKSFVLSPLVYEKKLIGGIVITSAKEQVSQDELNMLQVFGRAASKAVMNANLYDKTMRAAEALRESEEKFREMAELLPEVVYECDDQGIITFANKAAVEKFGLTLGDLDKGANTLWFIAPDDRNRAGENVEKIMRGIGKGPFEYTAQRKDGSGFPVITYSSPIIRDGKPVGLRGIVVDITERRAAEVELKETTKLLQSIMDNATNEAIITTDQMGIVLIWNEGAKRLLGYESKEMVGRESIRIFHTEEYLKSGTMDVNIKKMIAMRKPLTEELDYVTKDGKTIPVQEIVSPRFDEDGKFIGMVGMARDITERKKAEEELRLHAAMMDNVAEGVYLIGLDDLLIKWTNEKFARMFGYDPGEMVGKHVDIVNAPMEKTPAETRISIMEVLMETGEWHGEVRNIKRDGTHFWCSANVSLFNHPEYGKVSVSVHTDITERKKAEEEQEKLRVQLNQAQKMESVGRLAGGVAHDFNNMLGVILGYTQIAMRQVDPAQPIFADLQEIRTAAKRSADLTRQLLAFARKQTTIPRVLDLNETVDGMLKMLRRLIGEDIDLTWLPGAGLWPVKVDPAQVDQIMANLCVNARDSIEDVGKVIIKTENDTFDEAYCVDHTGFVPGEYVLLAVSDNGCGMDKETLDKIFEPFFTTKEQGKGTGLGLATVYGIVKQNSGFIDAYSEPGQGTTFKIYLPRHAAKATQMEKEGPAEPTKRGHETILLVEDEPSILRMTTRMLELQGYTVVAASTPGEAIRLTEAHPGEIHLLMTDVVMPEMNGRDLAKNLLSFCPNLKCLYMSGYAANVIAHHGVLDEGMNFLQKPFTEQDLAAKLWEALDSE